MSLTFSSGEGMAVKADYCDVVAFSRAKSLLRQIEQLIEEFNETADAIEDLGYGVPKDIERGKLCAWNGLEIYEWRLPFPRLIISSGWCEVNADAIELFLQAGKRRIAKPVRRMPLREKRDRLGIEQSWTCFYCGEVGDPEQGPDQRSWHVDHVYPLAKGGDDMQDNHVLACATCNLDKHTLTAMQYFKKQLQGKV